MSFHVKLTYTHHAGAKSVSAGDSQITFANFYEIDNEVLVLCEWAELRFSPFGELELLPPDSDEKDPVAKQYQEFLDGLTLDEVLEDSDPPHRWVIPVARITLSEGVGGGWPAKYAQAS